MTVKYIALLRRWYMSPSKGLVWTGSQLWCKSKKHKTQACARRCYEADTLRALRVIIQTFGSDTVLGFRSSSKWSEMNSLLKKTKNIKWVNRVANELKHSQPKDCNWFGRRTKCSAQICFFVLLNYPLCSLSWFRFLTEEIIISRKLLGYSSKKWQNYFCHQYLGMEDMATHRPHKAYNAGSSPAPETSAS